MSPGKEVNMNELFLTQTSSADNEKLCRLDVLGLEDSPTGDQWEVTKSFKNNCSAAQRGGTRQPCHGKETTLPSLTTKLEVYDDSKASGKKLERSKLLERYDNVMNDQLKKGIVERADKKPQGREFYIPHKPVVKK